eukprot:7763369-Karenia_brevis.AAC.1
MLQICFLLLASHPEAELEKPPSCASSAWSHLLPGSVEVCPGPENSLPWAPSPEWHISETRRESSCWP